MRYSQLYIDKRIRTCIPISASLISCSSFIQHSLESSVDVDSSLVPPSARVLILTFLLPMILSPMVRVSSHDLSIVMLSGSDSPDTTDCKVDKYLF